MTVQDVLVIWRRNVVHVGTKKVGCHNAFCRRLSPETSPLRGIPWLPRRAIEAIEALGRPGTFTHAREPGTFEHRYQL